MQDIRSKYVPPSLSETAFNCPHCGALSRQFWHSVYAESLKSKDAVPPIVTADKIPKFIEEIEDFKDREYVSKQFHKIAQRHPCMVFEEETVYDVRAVANLSISQCYNCDEVAVWIYDSLVHPRRGLVPIPSPDLPDDIRADYLEASSILDDSPRGAAALLRLCIQKLCKSLGESGQNINHDIKSLVEKGLDVRVQQALDVVRVVGNHAVHPGQIDLRDNRATATNLFDLVNLVTEIMISQPMHVHKMYDNLPKSDRDSIERRDQKKPSR